MRTLANKIALLALLVIVFETFLNVGTGGGFGQPFDQIASWVALLAFPTGVVSILLSHG